MKIVISYSGGLDSLILSKYAEIKYPEAEVIKVFWDIGQPYLHKELKALPPDVQVKKLDWLRSENDLKSKESATGNIYIPGRNLVLAVLASTQYLPDQVWMGALKGEDHVGATDKNQEFLDKTTDTLSYVLSPFDVAPKIRFPFVEEGWNKLNIIEWALNNTNLTYDDLKKTSSCLSGEGDGECGVCHVCVRRYGIFRQLNYEPRNELIYSTPQAISLIRAMIEDQLSESKNLPFYYNSYRRNEIIPAVQMDFPGKSLEDILKELKCQYLLKFLFA